MSYLTKDGKHILSGPIYGSYLKIEHDKCFECDDLMAPIVALLNKKGYKTEFSCSGHYSDHCFVRTYIEYNEELCNVNPGVYKIYYDKEDPNTEWEIYGMYDESEDIIVERRDDAYVNSYILFDKGVVKSKKMRLPRGWYFDDFTDLEGNPRLCIRYEYDLLNNYSSGLDFYWKVIKTMKKLEKCILKNW